MVKSISQWLWKMIGGLWFHQGKSVKIHEEVKEIQHIVYMNFLIYLYNVIFQQIDTPWTRVLHHYYLMFYMGHLYKLHIF